jgi:hypothetical protein
MRNYPNENFVNLIKPLKIKIEFVGDEDRKIKIKFIDSGNGCHNVLEKKHIFATLVSFVIMKNS